MAKTPTATGGTTETPQQPPAEQQPPADAQAQQQQQEQAQQEADAQAKANEQAQREQQEQADQRERAAQQQQEQPSSTPGSNDTAVATSANPSTKQVTQQGGRTVPAEGQRIREQARRDAEDRGDRVSLSDALNQTDPKLRYDDTGALVTEDGKRVALAADATDPDVGWTVQQAGAHVNEEDRVHHQSHIATVPDQTFHPAELPDPLAAVRAGQLPQNTEVLNIDPNKFKGKKSLEA